MSKSKQSITYDPMPIHVGDYIINLRSFVHEHETSILLVHGLGVSGDYYLPYAKALADHYNVYVIDLPGYGSTPKPAQPLTVSQLADVLLAFIQKRKLNNVVLVGQSMGCQIIAQAGTRLRGHCKRILLVGPTVNKNERSLLLQSIRLLQDTFHEPPQANAVVFGNYIRMGVRRYFKSARYMVNDHIEEPLALNTIPALIVRGSKDKIVSKQWVEYLHNITPMSITDEIPAAAHLAHYTHADHLADITKKFIET